MNRLRSVAEPDMMLMLRGTSCGRIRVIGAGFSATLGEDQFHDVQILNVEAAARLSALEKASRLAAPRDIPEEITFDFE